MMEPLPPVAESYKKLAEETEKEMEHPPFRVDAASLTMYANYDKVSWPINPRGHINPIRGKFIELTDQYKQKMEQMILDNATRGQLEKFSTDTDKQILELCLVDFDYEKAATNPDIGPVILQLMAQELQIFLVENGGKIGTSYLQTLQKLDILNRFNSSQNSKKSTESFTDSH